MKYISQYQNIASVDSSGSVQFTFILDEITKLLSLANLAVHENNYELRFKSVSKILTILYTLRSESDIESMDELSKKIHIFFDMTIIQLEKLMLIELKLSIPLIKSITQSISSIKNAISGSIIQKNIKTPTEDNLSILL